MRVLFIKDRDEPGPVSLIPLKRDPSIEVEEIPSLGKGIERLENGDPPDLIVCDYRGRGEAFLECILRLCPRVVTVVLTNDVAVQSGLHRIEREALFELVDRLEAPTVLPLLLKRLKDNSLAVQERDDGEFVRVPADGVPFSEPVEVDVYLRLGAGRYCLRFSASEKPSAEEIERFFTRQGIQEMYVRVDQAEVLLNRQIRKLDRLETVDSDPALARAAAIESLEILHDIVEKAGFTPQVQDVAKKSAQLTLKAVEANPHLDDIIQRLDRHRGRYIASHSVMLAELACAMAYQVGWRSASVLLKLCLAAFLHDLSLSDDRLAYYRVLPGGTPLTPKNVKAVRLHPAKSAEYARNFDDIPKDVDTILEQHHEQPDGSGFPRGLHHSKISPYSCLFIMAHDLLHFLLENVPTSDRSTMLSVFLNRNAGRYGEGMFQRLWSALQSGATLEI